MNTVRSLISGLLLSLALWLPAAGQDIDESLFYPDRSFDFSGDNPVFANTKSPATAFLLSFGATVGSVWIANNLIENDRNTAGGILLAGGLLIGPSAGNIYAGNGEGVRKGVETRLLSGAGMTIGMYVLLANNLFCYGDCTPSLIANVLGSSLFYGGAALVVYSIFYDWVNSAIYADRANRRRLQFRVTPGYDMQSYSPGIGLHIRF